MKLIPDLSANGSKHGRICRFSVLICASALMAVIFSSCFTGIESTKTISLSRNELKAMKPSDEENLLAGVIPKPLSDWYPGKQFLCLSPKASLIFDADGQDISDYFNSHPLSPISFEGIEDYISPDGSRKASIIFLTAGFKLRYDTGLNSIDAVNRLLSNELPLLADCDMLQTTDSILAGKTIFTRTAIWYDSNGNRVHGQRFVPIYVEAVEAGNESGNARIRFNTDRGYQAYIYFNPSAKASDSRSFPSLFYLSDPRTRYTNISENNWKLICEGKLKSGMTKEECRLSIGNPDEVESGHDYSRTLDIWRYRDGALLRFADGLLLDFRL